MPSTPLKITDLRVAVVANAPMTCPIIRIDTNQEGLYGLGEVRDGASKTYALMLKSRLLGEDPRDVDRLFRKIKQFGFHARQAGGVCAVEMALWDIVGKYYEVPVYQLLGGKFRDRIRIYADTDMSPDPAVTAKRLLQRVEQGFTFLKMDFMRASIRDEVIESLYGPTAIPPHMTIRDVLYTQHMFTGIEIAPPYIDRIAEYVAEVRRLIGWDISLAADHFGHIGINSCIRLGKALEPFNLAWLEDMIPWQYTDLWKRITDAINLPTCTGEDIYLKQGFEELCRRHAVDVIHPDLATSGGILETKKIGDMAQEYGIPMAMHFAGTPISCMANVHCAAATENFLVLENHSVDIPWWDDLVEGIEKPIIKDGFIRVPETPGLGLTLNDDVVWEHLLEPGYFEPTPEWDTERSADRLWS
jgi:L-alanine-DL-glutamate epimerase-like enolase superfamily enzyme